MRAGLYLLSISLLLSGQIALSANTAVTATQTGQTAQTPTDQMVAKYWGLSNEEYQRYQALMRGIRGSLSSENISPLEVLGIHARDDAERRKYAERFARVMVDDTQRVAAFQLAYDEAFNRLFPTLDVIGAIASKKPLAKVTDSPIISASSLTSSPAIVSGDRLLVFSQERCAPCDGAVRKAMNLLSAGIKVDLYLVGAKSPADVQRYARRLAVDPMTVARGEMTLNLDRGVFGKVLPSRPALPQVVRKRGDGLSLLTRAEF